MTMYISDFDVVVVVVVVLRLWCVECLQCSEESLHGLYQPSRFTIKWVL